MRDRSCILTSAQHECLAYASSRNDTPDSSRYFRGRLDVLIDICFPQVNPAATKDKSPSPVAGPSSIFDPDTNPGSHTSGDSLARPCSPLSFATPVLAPVVSSPVLGVTTPVLGVATPALVVATPALVVVTPAPILPLDSDSSPGLETVSVSHNTTPSLLVAPAASKNHVSVTMVVSMTVGTSGTSAGPLCQGHSTQRLSACRPLPKCLLVQLETTGRSSWST